MCTCADELNDRLKEAGHNTRVSQSYYMKDGGWVNGPVDLATHLAPGAPKKRGERAAIIQAKFCPFCGKESPK